MGTSTVLSAMEWQQPSRLPTTSSGDICMLAYKLHKHQRVSSGLSHLIKRVVWARCGRRKSLSRYAAESRWLKRQQTLKKRSLWKSTKGHAMISNTAPAVIICQSSSMASRASAKTKAASFAWFELNLASSRPIFLSCLFFRPRRFRTLLPFSSLFG